MNSMTEPTTVVIVPGLRDHVADHWQTLLAETLDNASHRAAARTRRAQPRRPGRRTRRGRRRRSTARSCWSPTARASSITVHWAQQSDPPIHGALLATPPDLEQPLPPGYPTTEELDRNGWRPIPRRRLPFPSIVAASSNDPLATHSAGSPGWPRRGAAGWSTSARSAT